MPNTPTPSTADAANARGPATYFPSIERTYGRPIDEWKAMMRATGLTTAKELATRLKEEHGFGHGHAMAISVHLLAAGTPRLGKDDLVDQLFTAKKAHWRPLYDRLAAEITSYGNVQVLPKKVLVGFAVKVQFVMLQPSTPERFDVGLKLAGVEPAGRLQAAGSWNTMMTHRVQLTDATQADAGLSKWMKQAYDLTKR